MWGCVFIEGGFWNFLQWSCATTGGEMSPVRWKHRCLKGEFRADRRLLWCRRAKGTLNFRMNTDREIGVSRSFWLFKPEMSKELPQGQLVHDEQVLRPLFDPFFFHCKAEFTRRRILWVRIRPTLDRLDKECPNCFLFEHQNWNLIVDLGPKANTDYVLCSIVLQC